MKAKSNEYFEAGNKDRIIKIKSDEHLSFIIGCIIAMREFPNNQKLRDMTKESVLKFWHTGNFDDFYQNITNIIRQR